MRDASLAELCRKSRSHVVVNAGFPAPAVALVAGWMSPERIRRMGIPLWRPGCSPSLFRRSRVTSLMPKGRSSFAPSTEERRCTAACPGRCRRLPLPLHQQVPGWPMARGMCTPRPGSFLDPRGLDDTGLSGYSLRDRDQRRRSSIRNRGRPQALPPRLRGRVGDGSSERASVQSARCLNRRLEIGHFAYWHVSPTMGVAKHVLAGAADRVVVSRRLAWSTSRNGNQRRQARLGESAAQGEPALALHRHRAAGCERTRVRYPARRKPVAADDSLVQKKERPRS